MTLLRETASGIAWAYGAFFIEKAATFLTSAILARFLIPEQFGIFATALVILASVEAFRDLGLRDAVIYVDDPDGDAADTAFWINVALGATLAALMVVAAPIAAEALETPAIADVLAGMSLLLVFAGASRTHEALLLKRLQFSRRYTVDVLSALAKLIVSVVLAFEGYGVWSIVIGLLAGAAVRTAGRWLACRWLPRLRFSYRRAGELLRYGMNIIGSRLMDFVGKGADQLAVMTLLGNLELGLYYIAMRLPDIVLQQFSVVLTQVMFPSYVRIGRDRPRLLSALFNTARYTSYFLFPTGVGLALVSADAILVLFGDQWHGSGPILFWLALAGIGGSLAWSIGDGFKAVGRPDLQTKLALVNLVYTVPLVFGAVHLTGDAVWAAAAMAVAAWLQNVILLCVARRVLGLGILQYLAVFRGAGLATLAMVLAVCGVQLLLEEFTPALRLFSSVLAGIAAYISALMVVDWAQFPGALRLLREAFGPQGHKAG